MAPNTGSGGPLPGEAAARELRELRELRRSSRSFSSLQPGGPGSPRASLLQSFRRRRASWTSVDDAEAPSGPEEEPGPSGRGRGGEGPPPPPEASPGWARRRASSSGELSPEGGPAEGGGKGRRTLGEPRKPSPKSSFQLSRTEVRNRDCRDLFELEPSEELEDEYSCALHKKILLQGRMYVFTSKVCFFSNVFGYVTKKTLDLKAVTSVRKTNNMGFPNSIEIVYNGKVYFFTSFLYRNEAYKIIVRRWTAAAPGYARLFLGDDASGEKGGRHRRALSEGLRKEGSRSKGRSTISHGPGPRQPVSMDRKRVTITGGESPPLLASPSRRLSITSLLMGSPSLRAEKPRRADSGAESEGSLSLEQLLNSARKEGREGTPGRYDSQGSLRSHNTSNSGEDREGHSEPEKQKRLSQDSLPEILSNGDETLSGDDGQYMDEDLGGTYLPPHAGEPAEARGMECIYEGLVAGKFEHLYAKVLANGSEFLEKLHASLGDTEIECSQWERAESIKTFSRTFAFKRKLPAYLTIPGMGAAPTTRSVQTHKLRYFKDAVECYVWESSQRIAGIPYGDCFTVEARWEFRSVPEYPGRIMVKHYFAVPFSKSTVWKSSIVRNTKSQMADYRKQLVRDLEAECHSDRSDDEALQDSTNIDADKIPVEWRDQIHKMLNIGGGDGPFKRILSPGKKRISFQAAKDRGRERSATFFSVAGLVLVLGFPLRASKAAVRASCGLVARNFVLLGFLVVLAVQFYILQRLNEGAAPPGASPGAKQAEIAYHKKHISMLANNLKLLSAQMSKIQKELADAERSLANLQTV